MTANREFERQLGEWLREDSSRRVPDHLNEVLVRTVATRQRPWWSSPRRWLPIDITAPRAPLVPSGSWRPILLVVAVLLLVATLVVLAVGSSRRLPPPFGLARNGLVVASSNGDIMSVDPSTGAASPLITDPAFDFGPTFSRDGTKLVFLRSVASGQELVVADPDGGHPRAIIPPVDGIDSVDWSSDSQQIAFLTRISGRGEINVVNVDGSGSARLDVGQPANQLSWLPPDGAEILFRGEHLNDGDPSPGIFAVHPDGSGLRAVSLRRATDANDYQDVTVSPDGTLLAYRAAVDDEPFRVRILDLRTGADRVLPSAPGSAGEGGPLFSPDGRSIVYLRWAPDSSTQLVVAPVDGSGVGTPVGPRGPLGQDGPTINNYAFTPDGTAVVANFDAEKIERLLPIDGSPGSILARGDLAFASYQRLAP